MPLSSRSNASSRGIPFTQLVTIAALVLAGRTADAGSPFPIGAASGATAHFAAPLPPTIRAHGPHSGVRSDVAYTIDDIGGPYPAFANSFPVAFNNSGQFLGYGYSASKGVQTCIVYAAGKFVNASASSNDVACFPQGMSSQDSQGVARFVGYVATPFDEAPVGFLGTVNAAGKAALTPFSAHSPSNLAGVNLGGQAIGSGHYVPVGGFYSAYPQFVANAGAISVAQPYCTTVAQYCASPVQNTLSGCAFGGCSINDSGTVLAIDPSNGELMTYAPGAQRSGADYAAIPAAYLVGGEQLNNAGQILYSAYDKAHAHIYSYVYTASSGASSIVPAIAGSTCADYYGISLNNLGQILGYTGNCTNPNDSIYWTWDPADGIQNLNAEIPSNSYSGIIPQGINDNGSILVSLIVPPAGLYDWGTLAPTPAARTHNRRRGSPSAAATLR